MSPEWLIIRGSGIVAYLLLAGATIWGLLLSTKVLGRAVKAKPVTWFHESLGLGAVLATIVHMVALGADQYVDFGWRELLLPGASTWRPLPVAFGVTAFYALLLVAFSFYLKRFIRQSTWRAIHFLSFGTFAAVLLHGVLSGTDSGEPAVFGMYVATGTIVLVLVAIRLFQARTPTTAARRPRPQAGSGMPREAETDGTRATDAPVQRPAAVSGEARPSAAVGEVMLEPPAAPSQGGVPVDLAEQGVSRGQATESTLHLDRRPDDPEREVASAEALGLGRVDA